MTGDFWVALSPPASQMLRKLIFGTQFVWFHQYKEERENFGAVISRRTDACVSVALQAEGENVSKLEKADILVRLAYVNSTLLLLRIFSLENFCTVENCRLA